MNLQTITFVLERAGHLFCLALAPVFLPPEPAPSAHFGLAALLSAIALGLVAFAAIRLRARIATREASAAALLILISVAVSLAFAAYFNGPRAPLGRAVPFVAIPLWLGLAAAVWVALRQRQTDNQTRLYAVFGTLVLGALQLGASSAWLTSVENMWWFTLTRDGDSARALQELLGPNAQDAAAARAILDRCVSTNPTSCLCLSKRSDLKRKTRDLQGALADVQAAAKTCATDAAVQSALVLALVANGDAAQAERAARAALEKSSDPQLHYGLAIALEGQGRVQDATAAARKAVELGAGRDPALLLAALSIVAGDFDAAANLLEPFALASPNDAEVRYNLALIADKKNDFNRAREGYLAALRGDPTLVNARYNLALLTLRRGIIDEARHHARKFVEAAPNDSRGADLLRRIDAARTAPRP